MIEYAKPGKKVVEYVKAKKVVQYSKPKKLIRPYAEPQPYVEYSKPVVTVVKKEESFPGGYAGSEVTVVNNEEIVSPVSNNYTPYSGKSVLPSPTLPLCK